MKYDREREFSMTELRKIAKLVGVNESFAATKGRTPVFLMIRQKLRRIDRVVIE